MTWEDAVTIAVGYTIGTVVSRWLIGRYRTWRAHRRTDPACSRHRPIRGPFARWRDRRSRGKACMACWTGRWTP